MICQGKEKLFDLGEGHIDNGNHVFCQDCIRKYHEQITGGMIIEEEKDRYMLKCPIRNCGVSIDQTEWAANLYKDNFDKYKKTAKLTENPFAKSTMVNLVEENKGPEKAIGKCFMEQCNATKGYATKSKECDVYCQFFACKSHIKEASNKLNENGKKCPSCNKPYTQGEVIKYKKGTVEIIDADMIYRPSEKD